ncbi:MAG: hypothetical protein A2928_00150 [Candidatus Taylorbacteria bacterium RIFCSPLOWO2_01_FULL_45_15b]|uniref:AFP-like domain-containing protein n=1 Tax=Candidatus Taylorbacteria bacterium RIFCSPLOWO2_01_FULL_45_15b TaxID=1802319 RepID=A0A1G2N8F0_9BACT|nr:MAG: hypothetical protein A2928_00150 [Candidatus Taylorbacteria bacterium RIFCSPLOWO2_01_FULL_45_15b]
MRENTDVKKFFAQDRVFVIAEIGKNFIQTEGERPIDEYLENAKALIKAAKDAGADAVKFQTHEVEDEQYPAEITSPHFKSLDRLRWLTRNTNATPFSFWKEIKAYSEKLGIVFFSTPMSRKAAEKLSKVGVPIWKLGSGDVEDFHTINYLATTKKPLIISTGMVSRKELGDVVSYIQKKNIPLSILYCISAYPCSPESFNLASIKYLKEKYPDANIGFSDHSIDSHLPALAAVKLGARIIEKHFSFARDLWGSDHKASINPDEMKKMVRAIRKREYEKIDHTPYYGKYEKEFEGATNQFRPYFKKAIVASTDIPEGVIIGETHVYTMRPAKLLDGLPAKEIPNVLGKRAKRRIKSLEPIRSDMID